MMIILLKTSNIKVPELAANNRLSFIERFLKVQLKAKLIALWSEINCSFTTSSLTFKPSATLLDITRSKI